jgi:magnesium chelatase subunit D
VELAEKALHKVPVGGKTPLSSGLLLAYRVLKREMQRSPDVMPLMILLTDGAANVSMTELPPQEEALKIADLIRREGIQSVVINMEYPSFDRGLASDLAEALDAKCYNLDELNAEGICRMVKAELGYYYGEEL